MDIKPGIIAIILISFLSLMLSGCTLGFKQPEQCDGLLRRSQMIECYHIAAISKAYLNEPDTAKKTCLKIWSKAGPQSVGGSYDDVSKKAEAEMNNCYMDIARILGDPAYCDLIQDQGSANGLPNIGLVGQTSNQKMCLDMATKANKLKPQNYVNSQEYKDSLCNLMFIFPALLAGAFVFRK